MTSLKKRAEKVGLEVDGRWSPETLKQKIEEAESAQSSETDDDHSDLPERTTPTSNKPGTEKGDNISPDHWPAKSEETSNENGEETEADNVAADKNADGRTNEVDFVKNTGKGPGNPDQRNIDPRELTDQKPIEVPGSIVADTPYDNDGNELQTEETAKVVHETVTASGNREVDNNVLPDMNARSPLVIKANELNIRVDPEWDDNRLRAEIQAAREGRADWQVKGAIPPAEYGDVNYDPQTASDKKVTIGLTADVWEDDGDGGSRRVSADSDEGKNYRTTKANAQKLLDEGKAKRTDPLK